MSEQAAQIPPEQPKKREKLSDEKLGNILSAVGNNEAKGLTLFFMSDGKIYDSKNLYRQIIEKQGKNIGWRMSRTVPFGYCSKTLAPIGLVARETINPDLSTYGYTITDDGQELGIPLAGLLLEFSERHNISLNLLFGATNSSSKEKTLQTEEGDIEFKKRSPITTLKILYELLTSPELPIRETDLATGIGVEEISNITSRLNQLSNLGLIEYKSTEVNKPKSSFKLSAHVPEGELPMYYEHPTLTKLVFDVLKKHPEEYLTIIDVYNLLPQEKRAKRNSNKVPNDVSSILSFLTKHKYAEVENFHLDKQSSINLTSEQRIVLIELLEIIDSIQNQDQKTLKRGRRFAEEIIASPNRVASLLRRAKEVSGQANKSSLQETEGYILSIISANLGITNKEIQRLLENRYGKKLGIIRVRDLSHSLVKQNSVREEKEGSVSKFYPNSEKF